MEVVSLHRDVLVARSALLAVNCTIVRGPAEGQHPPGEGPLAVIAAAEGPTGETFVVDSPVLPDELAALPALLAQARFPIAGGLLATHADWDHLLGRLAFPGLALGCAESTAERLLSEPGAAQRRLREFDEELYLHRPTPLALGAPQPLPTPGRCEIGARELELHPTGGHTVDGMAILIPWAEVLVAGDYLSALEIPMISEGGALGEYEATLRRLAPLVAGADRVVPGHGPVLDRATASGILEEDLAYLAALGEHGPEAPLPPGRNGRVQKRIHEDNLRVLAESS